eukprot:480700_1
MSDIIETPPRTKPIANETSLLLDPMDCRSKSGTSYTNISENESIKIPNKSSLQIEEILPFYQRPIFWFKISIVLFLAVIFILAWIYYEQVLKYFVIFLRWIKDHPVQGIFVYLFFCWLYLALFGPETLITVGGGFVFTHTFGTIGIPISIGLVFVGTQLGATQAFLNGRYLMRNCTERLANRYPQFKVIDKIVEQQGFKIVFLLRLTPITPYNAMNYLMGLTAISVTDYMLGTFGIIPDCIMMCFIGSFLSSILEIEHVSQNLSPREKKAVMILSIVGTIVAFGVAVYVAFYAKKQFQKYAKEIKLSNEENNQVELSKNESTRTV